MLQVITWKPSTSLANNYLFTRQQVSMSRFRNIVRLGFLVIWTKFYPEAWYYTSMYAFMSGYWWWKGSKWMLSKKTVLPFCRYLVSFWGNRSVLSSRYCGNKGKRLKLFLNVTPLNWRGWPKGSLCYVRLPTKLVTKVVLKSVWTNRCWKQFFIACVSACCLARIDVSFLLHADM